MMGLGLAMLWSGLSAAQPAPVAIDPDIMRTQVILDRLGFSPGVIDGKKGQSLALALRGFQMANGLTPSGQLDQPTTRALAAYRRGVA